MPQYGDGFEEPQPEQCALCGEVVGRGHLIYSQVEGFRGFAICDRHAFETEARVSPSYRDLRSRQAPFSPDPRMLERQPPFGIGSSFGTFYLRLEDETGWLVLEGSTDLLLLESAP